MTSADVDSTIVGDGKSRSFSVVNASLHLCNITLSNGNTTYGGAISASSSRVTFEGVVFAGNVATSSGGAILVSRQTYASFGEEISSTALPGTLPPQAAVVLFLWKGESTCRGRKNCLFPRTVVWAMGGAFI